MMIRTKPLVLSRPIRRRWTPFSDLFGNPFRPGHEQWRRYSLKSSTLRLCCETLFHIHMIPVTLTSFAAVTQSSCEIDQLHLPVAELCDKLQFQRTHSNRSTQLLFLKRTKWIVDASKRRARSEPFTFGNRVFEKSMPELIWKVNLSRGVIKTKDRARDPCVLGGTSARWLGP